MTAYAVPTQKPGKGDLSSSDLFFVFDSGTTPALGADPIPLTTSYPGYVAGDPKRPARVMMFLGGQLDTTLANGVDSPIDVLFAGKALPCAADIIKASSTATQLLIIW